MRSQYGADTMSWAFERGVRIEETTENSGDCRRSSGGSARRIVCPGPAAFPGRRHHYVTRPAAYADIAATVSETGIVNPVTQVLVGSEVSGTIRTLTVDFNSKVRKGQVLANLDPTTYQAAVDSAQANLMLAQANADNATVNVGKMKAQLDLANLTVQRDKPLFTQGLINQNQMDIGRPRRSPPSRTILPRRPRFA